MTRETPAEWRYALSRLLGMGGVYSSRWRKTFGRSTPHSTELEVAFLTRTLPLPDFRHVLDVPCGWGRHMAGLGAAGYVVVGVDNDAEVVREAAASGLDARLGDMREVAQLGPFDAVVNLWASFGFFDEDENARALRAFHDAVREGGRVVLDVTDGAFFESRQGERVNAGVRDRKWIDRGRLYTQLTYPDGAREGFDWQLWAAEGLEELGRACGLHLVLACAEFDEAVPAAGGHPRMQLVFERRASG